LKSSVVRALEQRRSGSLASLPEIHNPDRDHQQTQVHRERRQNHGAARSRESGP
jgi:hypothetical protein